MSMRRAWAWTSPIRPTYWQKPAQGIRFRSAAAFDAEAGSARRDGSNVARRDRFATASYWLPMTGGKLMVEIAGKASFVNPSSSVAFGASRAMTKRWVSSARPTVMR